METKPTYQSMTKAYPFRAFYAPVPTEIWIDAMLEAQYMALAAILDIEGTIARLSLFWVVYNFEFRQYIERWLRENAVVEA